MSKKLVAFCGAKESGKSTSAILFKDLIGQPTVEVAFAGHLKEVCSQVFDVEMKYFLEPKLKERELNDYKQLTKERVEKIFELFDVTTFDYDKHIRPHTGQVFDTPRKILQYVGTEVLHPIDPLIHVNVTLKKINPDVITLVTDLRFPQEFDALYGREDFLPVHVQNTRAELAAEADSHASEKGWQKFKDRCVVLDNNGPISKLTDNLKQMIKEKV